MRRTPRSKFWALALSAAMFGPMCAASLPSVAAFEAQHDELLRLGKSLSAKALAESVAAQAAAAGDRQLEAEALMRGSHDYPWEASRACRAASLLVGLQGSKVRHHLATAACERIGSGSAHAAMKQALAAVELARISKSADDRVRALAHAVFLASSAGDPLLTKELALEAVGIEGLPLQHRKQMQAQLDLAGAYEELGQRQLAIQTFASVEKRARSAGDREMEASSLMQRGAFSTDTLEEQIALHERLLPLLELFEDADRFGVGLSNLADAYVRAGQPEKALAAANRGLEVVGKSNPRADAVDVIRFNKGMALNRMGRHEEGLALVAESTTEASGGWDAAAAEFAFAGRYRQAYDYLAKHLASMKAPKADAQKLHQVMRQVDAERFSRLEAEARLHQTERRQAVIISVATGLLLLLAVAALTARQRWLKRQAADLAHFNAELAKQAKTDALTGLNNRHHFNSVIGREIAAVDRAYSDQGAPDRRADLTFFLIDLDRFKQVNDQLGHAAGDEVLKQAALRLTALLRTEDELVRWGGEEFLLMTRGTVVEGAITLANRIREAMADAPFALTSGPLHVTCSIGFARYPLAAAAPGLPDWQGVVELADQALYEVKEHGRNGWMGILSSRDPLVAVDTGSLAQAFANGSVTVVRSWQGERATESLDRSVDRSPFSEPC